MKKLLLLTAIVTVIGCASLGLAVLFSGQGTFTVNETITVSAVDLDVTIEPNETVQKTITVSNTGTEPTNVIVTAEVVDDAVGGPYAGVTVTDSQAVTVDAGQSADLTFTIAASNGVQPGTGTVHLDVIRP